MVNSFMVSVVRCESLGGFEESLSDDQGEESQGEKHLVNAAAGGGVHRIAVVVCALASRAPGE